MTDNKCTCDFLPCICVGDDDSAVDFLKETGDENVTKFSKSQALKLKLRQLFASDATSQCVSCMMLPCICPMKDETTSGNNARPRSSEHKLVSVNEETDIYDRVRLDAPSTKCKVQGDGILWIAKEIKPLLKPHQIEGVYFLHSHLAASRGCILADYMGLGKTLQVITVIYSFIIDENDVRTQRNANNMGICASIESKSEKSHDQDKRDNNEKSPATVLVLCPAICLSNWETEFQKWLGTDARARCPILTFDTSSVKSTNAGRLRLLRRWKRTGGVMLMGYEMFRGLLNPTTLPVSYASERDAPVRVCSRMVSATMEITSTSAQETLQVQRTAREYQHLLCAPGADLVVMDEGHRMKDPSSLLCQSVAQIQSPRRLVLTGYPLQNSLSEYYCMVNFAREGFLGSYDNFRARYERPILERNRARSNELIELLQSVVLRRGKALLRSQLPPKLEWILYCKLSPVQHQLYCDFLDYYSDGNGVTADLLTAYATLLQVMNHPDIIYSKLHPFKDGANALQNEEEDESNSTLLGLDVSNGWVWESEERLHEKQQAVVARRRKKRQNLTNIQKSLEWARSAIFNKIGQEMTTLYQAEKPEHSGKMVVLLSIVKHSILCGDKVVVFSQSIPTLKVISTFLRASNFSPSLAADDVAKACKSMEDGTIVKLMRRRTALRPNRDPAGILRKRRNQTESSSLGKRAASCTSTPVSSVTTNEWFLQIDGSTSGAKRMEYIQRFSSADSPVKVLLVSTRAGAEGINLHAANRLVLFDVSWNPSNDHQSMCRSHRIGQAKTVHVYRLVSTGTMERMIYEQQKKKVDLSTAVVDSHELVDQKKHATDLFGCASTNAGLSAKDGENLVPFSGFLQPPSKVDYDMNLNVDQTIIKEDDVLASCVKQLGHWLVDVHRVHEPLDAEK
ncbi:unnamed protein product [Peronospora belbahrii]|uniref:Uncharacterized protein n=1 Tax=Peronospora belbahrii TaxID=622444 RepID=A0AAU9KPF7_9STRA|nr:unnamed protein product [Peronospora belbahrii]